MEKIDLVMLEYGSATEKQRAAVHAYNEHGCYNLAAAALGCDESTVREHVKRVKEKAALRGYSPEADATATAPDPFIVKGKSTFYGTDKKTGVKSERGQWVKTDLKLEAYTAAVKAALRDELIDIKQIPVAPCPPDFQDDIIPWVQIGDAHLGMLAHIAETNDNFDLKIAERELLTGVFQLIDDLPACGRLVINDLGDATHYENMAGTTEASGNILDYDGRFPKMIRAYRRIMQAIVERACTKAQHVDILINQGNHSRTNDFWMAELLRACYEHTGRVHILDNDSEFIGYRMGKTLVMVHHSDKTPPKRLVDVLITDFRKDFGETEYHYIDIGHVHHHYVSKEYPSVVLESWNNLAPNDKWHHDSGYRSRKGISVVFRSRRFGEVGRRHMPLQEVRHRILQNKGISSPAKKEVYSV